MQGSGRPRSEAEDQLPMDLREEKRPQRWITGRCEFGSPVAGEPVEKTACQREDVLATLAQRRNVDLDDVEPGEEIFAELIRPHCE
jgi:hypothetical protein